MLLRNIDHEKRHICEWMTSKQIGGFHDGGLYEELGMHRSQPPIPCSFILFMIIIIVEIIKNFKISFFFLHMVF